MIAEPGSGSPREELGQLAAQRGGEGAAPRVCGQPILLTVA